MAANIVRREMFKKRNNFSGSFEPKCQDESIPISCTFGFGCMTINGPNIEAQSSASSMPQPILYHCTVCNSFI